MDVLIVGAGVMGSALAWRLGLAGVHATVLERAIPGAEASSAAGGILAPRLESTSPALLAFALASLELYPAWADALRESTGIDVGFRRCGVLHAALDDAGLAAQENLDGEVVDVPPWLVARRAVLFPDEGTVDNRLLVDALRLAAIGVGARYLTGQTVTGLDVAAGRVRGVRTEQGAIAADTVVICAGAWTSLLHGIANLRIRPVRGQMLMLQGPVPPIPHVVYAAGRGYLVPRMDGRILIGSTSEDVGFEKAITPEGLRHLAGLACEVVPSLARVPIVEQWAGFRPATPDHLPAIGRLGPEGLWVSSGHHRHGILLTPVTAERLADAILGRSSGLDAAFDPARFP